MLHPRCCRESTHPNHKETPQSTAQNGHSPTPQLRATQEDAAGRALPPRWPGADGAATSEGGRRLLTESSMLAP